MFHTFFQHHIPQEGEAKPCQLTHEAQRTLCSWILPIYSSCTLLLYTFPSSPFFCSYIVGVCVYACTT